MHAPTDLESGIRDRINSLDGFGNYSPITVPFADRLDTADLLRWRAQARLWRNAAGDRAEARAFAEAAREAYAAIGMKRHVEVAEALLAAAVGESA